MTKAHHLDAASPADVADVAGVADGAGRAAGVPAGHRLFARYAHAPNARGFCGPELGAALQRLAAGHTVSGLDVPAAARRFSGAWPYQALLAEHAGRVGHGGHVGGCGGSGGSGGGALDPLEERVVRAYWTGNDLTELVDARAYGTELLARFGAQAGHYWQHLTPELLPEVMPTHAFHVFGVYPWSRLLGRGAPEPVGVLDDCRIRVGRVLDVGGDELLVEIDRLVDESPGLRLSTPRPERVIWRTQDGPFIDAATLRPGACVAVHWNFACDELTAAEAATCQRLTVRQVEHTDSRLRRAAAD